MARGRCTETIVLKGNLWLDSEVDTKINVLLFEESKGLMATQLERISIMNYVLEIAKGTLASVALLTAAGCVPTTNASQPMVDNLPTISPVPKADTYGPAPKGTKQTVLSYLQGTLKDPESMKGFGVQEPKKGSLYGGITNGFKMEPQWYVCYTYNAKNSYGGYVGQKEFVMWFKNGSISQSPRNVINPFSTKGANPYHQFNC